MRNRFAGLFVSAILLAVLSTSAQPGGGKPDKKLEVQLLWGTDAKTSPNKDHKPVEPDIQKRLKNIPLKWSNYFMVKKMTFSVPRGQATNIAMSEKCSLGVKDLGKTNLEISFVGKNKPLEKRVQALPRGEVFIYSGNAPGTNAWLIVLKRLD